MWSKKNLHTMLMEVWTDTNVLENRLALKMHTFYDPIILFLDNCPIEMCAYMHHKTCTKRFLMILFTVVKTIKQHKYPLTVVWIKNWDIFR